MIFSFLSAPLGDLHNIFNNYGWPGLLVVGLGFTLVFFFKRFFNKSTQSTNSTLHQGFNTLAENMQSQNEKLLEAMIKQNEENNKTIGKVLDTVLKEKDASDKKIHDDKMNSRWDVSRIIRNKIRDLLNRYNADRIFILEFHNCKENVVGMPFYWYDMVYEEIAKGAKHIHVAWRDQEASQLIPIVDDMEEFGGYKVYTIEDLEELQNTSSVLYRKLRIEREVQEAIITALYSHENALLGLLVFEYEDKGFIPIEVLNDIDIISEANSIATLLDCTVQ